MQVKQGHKYVGDVQHGLNVYSIHLPHFYCVQNKDSMFRTTLSIQQLGSFYQVVIWLA